MPKKLKNPLARYVEPNHVEPYVKAISDGQNVFIDMNSNTVNAELKAAILAVSKGTKKIVGIGADKEDPWILITKGSETENQYLMQAPHARGLVRVNFETVKERLTETLMTAYSFWLVIKMPSGRFVNLTSVRFAAREYLGIQANHTWR